MIFYVYTHARPDGSTFYVGKGTGSRSRNFKLRSPWHENIVAKYGADKILVEEFECPDEATAFDLEKFLIKELRVAGSVLVNLSDGGEGPTGCKWTEAAKANNYAKTAEFKSFISKHNPMKNPAIAKKNALTRVGDINHSKRKEVREKISASLKGRKATQETRNKISLAFKCKKKSPEHTAKAKAAWLAKHGKAARAAQSQNPERTS
jgi:hypothetical protein